MTQAAEGYPRLRWTLAEFEKLADVGILTEQDRIELIGGELVPMSPKGNRHERIRGKLLLALMKQLPPGVEAYSELGWRPGGDVYCEPEIVICPAVQEPSTLPARDVLLLIEVADTSLKYDHGLKAETYAALGVREYWVVNAVTLETTVHLLPTESGYASKRTALPGELSTPHLVPELALRLGELGLGS